MESQTERLILAPLREQDARELYEVRGDPEVMQFWDWPHDNDLAATESVVATYLQAVDAKKKFFWTARLRADGNFVGICDLSELGADKSAEIGFILARRFWGLGFGREVVRGLIERARDLDLKVLWARVHSGNERSVRLLRRLGFTELASLPNFEIRPGICRDCRRFEIQLTNG